MPPIGSFATDIGGSENTSGPMPDFAFVPQQLTAQCRSLIESYHRTHGYSCLPDMLWHADSRGLIRSNKELGRIFKKASMARRVRLANSSLLFVATVVMALEALLRNFADWGSQFPEARRKAEMLLGASPPNQRVWFMDTYLSASHPSALHGADRTPAARIAPRADHGRQLDYPTGAAPLSRMCTRENEWL
jgi:hypothetical protein